MISINYTDLTFNIAFCVGIFKYLTTTYKRTGEESVEMYRAISYGMLNGIRIILLSYFVPTQLRLIIPAADIISFIIRIVFRKKHNVSCKLQDYDLEKNIKNEQYACREMEHIHIE